MRARSAFCAYIGESRHCCSQYRAGLKPAQAAVPRHVAKPLAAGPGNAVAVAGEPHDPAPARLLPRDLALIRSGVRSEYPASRIKPADQLTRQDRIALPQ
jgi:hypothetical protein